MRDVIDLKKPTIEQVNFYLEKWQSLDNYVLQENALNKLFQLLPTNSDISDVLLKSATLNDFYSTNIFSIYPIAKHILTIPNFDEKLIKGDPILVDEIKKITIKEKEKNFYSFATKYCSHHNPNAFPIYDSYVDKILVALNKKYHFAKFKRAELKEYARFKEILSIFQKEFGLNEFSLKQLDVYLWLLGKDIFSRKTKA